MKQPKVNNKVKIPMRIEMISKAVINTHLPSYVVRRTGSIGSGGCHPCHGFHKRILPQSGRSFNCIHFEVIKVKYGCLCCSYPKIISSNLFPGGTIGITFSSCSMINSITVGTSWVCFARSNAVIISVSSVTRIPFAP